METVAVHFHCSPALGEALPLEAADDAVKVRWLRIQDNPVELSRLYASHQDFIQQAVRHFEASTARK